MLSTKLKEKTTSRKRYKKKVYHNYWCEIISQREKFSAILSILKLRKCHSLFLDSWMTDSIQKSHKWKLHFLKGKFHIHDALPVNQFKDKCKYYVRLSCVFGYGQSKPLRLWDKRLLRRSAANLFGCVVCPAFPVGVRKKQELRDVWAGLESGLEARERGRPSHKQKRGVWREDKPVSDL